MAYMALVLLLIFIAIMLLGIPVGFGMGALTVIAFELLGGDLSMIPQKMFAGIDTYTYVCILLFILSADIMSVGGITNAIVVFCEKLVGHIKGGLAHVNVLASMLFAGLSGSAAADAAGLGPIEIKMMTDGGYDKEFSSCLTAASAIIGPIIPPSNIMIIYAGCVGTVSVGKMFLAGAIPGILLGHCLHDILLLDIREAQVSLPEDQSDLERDRPCHMGDSACSAPAHNHHGYYYPRHLHRYRVQRHSGHILHHRRCLQEEPQHKVLLPCLHPFGQGRGKRAVHHCDILCNGMAVTTLGVAQALTNFCVAYINNKIVFLLFVNVLLLLIGMLLDASPALLLMVPILWPVAKTLGIDAIHFGVMVCFNLMVGTLTPPVGMMLFIVSNVGKVKLSVMYKGILPFVAVAVVVLLLITYVPSLTTWLPRVLMP